ncbi:MAG: hypothetical protein II247_03355, partial [Lachnospiraceae bacterium]|nr:hypothetical protein [Lachnospiraceae bacterium]
MEENNKFETNASGAYSSPQNNLQNEGSVYGAETTSQTNADANSSVYDQPIQQETQAVSLAKPSSEENVQSEQPVNNDQPMGSQQPMTGAPQGFNGQPVNGMPQGFNGQPMTGAPQGFNGQPVNGMPQGFNGQPVNGMPQGFNGQPMNGAPQGFNGQQVTGAPTGYQQQPGFEPGFIPGQNPGQNGNGKKSKAGLVIGIIAAVAVVLVIAIAVLLSQSLFGGGSGAKKVQKGFANMAKEMEAYTCSVSDELGSDAIEELFKKKPSHINGELSLTDPESSQSVKISLDAVTDLKNKQGKYNLQGGMMGINIDAGTIVADNNTIYVSSPVFLRDNTYAIETTDLGKKFNDSVWAELMETELEDDLSFELFEENDKDKDNDANAAFAEVISKSLKKYDKSLKKATQYKTLGEKKEFNIGGKAVSCGGVGMVVEKDAFNEMMEGMKEDILASEEYAAFAEGFASSSSDAEEAKRDLKDAIEKIFSTQIDQDLEIDFYFDSKGRIVGIKTPGSIAVSSYGDVDAFEIDIEFTGAERTLDEVSGGIYISSADDILFMGITRRASVSKDQYSEYLTVSLEESGHEDDISITYSNDWYYADQSFDMYITMYVGAEHVSVDLEGS